MEAQERVLAVSEVRSISRSLQRDALNLITESDPAERDVIVKKFDERTRRMREMLRHLEDTKTVHALPENYFRLSHTVIAALGEVAAKANASDRKAALDYLRKVVRPAERAASKVADAQIDAMTDEVAALRHTAAVAQRAANRMLLVAVIFLSLLAVAVGALTEMIRREQARLIVRNIGSSLHKLAGGDLTTRIEAALIGEFSKLKSDFNHAVDALGNALASVRISAKDIAAGAEELMQSSGNLSERTERQAASLEETAGALQQLSGALSESANSAVEVRRVVGEAHQDAEHSGVLLKDAITAIGRHRADVQRDRRDHPRDRRDRLPDQSAGAQRRRSRRRAPARRARASRWSRRRCGRSPDGRRRRRATSRSGSAARPSRSGWASGRSAMSRSRSAG